METRMDERARLWLRKQGRIIVEHGMPITAPVRSADLRTENLNGSVSIWFEGEDAVIAEIHDSGTLTSARKEKVGIRKIIRDGLLWFAEHPAHVCVRCGRPATMSASRGWVCADHYDDLSD